MGHAPTMSLDTYAHLIAELDGAERIDPVELIAQARETAASVCTGCTPDTVSSTTDGAESVASNQAL